MSDRRAKLEGQRLLNGIDFVEVTNLAQTQLRVHFVNRRPDADALAAKVTRATITGGETIPEVRVLPVSRLDWSTDAAGRPTLDLRVRAPGDFSNYLLSLGPKLVEPVLDPFFDHVRFSFKAGCPSNLDCEPSPTECPPPADAAPAIDYLAKDFQSFRKALSDFSRLRYPGWQERSEADFGVMFMEALSSLADDLSYQQDRIAAEAWLETATERRSLVRLARLVDYEPRVATAARVWLEFGLDDATAIRAIPTGTLASALAPDGTAVDFEVGTGLNDPNTEYAARSQWNRGKLSPYWWDDEEQCLSRGSSEMWIKGWGHGLEKGQVLLIDTAAEPPADPPKREILRLVADGEESSDPLYGEKLTHIEWRAEDRLRFDHDLSRSEVAGNIVPATEGRRTSEVFRIQVDGATPLGVARAIVRTGANRSLQFLHTLKRARLAWLAGEAPGEGPRPEIHVAEVTDDGLRPWTWRRKLLAATPFEQVFTVDPMRYRMLDTGTEMADYDGDGGDTLRFGDGVFGAIPGDRTSFELTYRTGGGTRGNVASGAVERVDPTSPIAGVIKAVTNPLPAEGGLDEESAERVREMAPQAFRARQFRAVRAEDYQRAAEQTLDWVQRAGTQFRYTGSWLSVFTAVDPKGSESLPAARRLELSNLLNRYRLAGYETFGLAPRYASLDLRVKVCARPDAFRGDVERALLAALDATVRANGSTGFFHPDRFTFGLPLERSALEGAIQEVPGVDGVLEVRYRRRGHTPGFVAMPDAVEVSRDEIVRVDNDPSRPERGSLRVEVRGGK